MIRSAFRAGIPFKLLLPFAWSNWKFISNISLNLILTIKIHMLIFTAFTFDKKHYFLYKNKNLKELKILP